MILGVSSTFATPKYFYTQRFESLVSQSPNPPPYWHSSLPCFTFLASPGCPSYWSGRMFLLLLLCCWTSIQFDFLAVLVIFCFLICCCSSFGCTRDKVYLHTPASCLEVYLVTPSTTSLTCIRLPAKLQRSSALVSGISY